MNGKRAKQLRKQAQEMTIGMSWCAYDFGKPPVFKNIGNDRIPIFKKVAKGIPTKLKARCTRSVYQKLKKAA